VSGVAGRLAVLARHGATGALEITGDPGGTIYLQNGCLAFAESPVAPDLGGVCVITPPGADIRWSPANPDVLRDALGALRRLA